jgi:FkbM family methyltransferase
VRVRRILGLLKRIFQVIIPNRLFSFFFSRVVGEYNQLSSGEKIFFELIESHVTSIVDIGARTDTFYANYPSSNGIHRKVFMFEANPAFASRLRKITTSIDENNFVFNIAIGKEPGSLYYFYDTQSFIEKSNVGNISKYKSAKPIDVRTLDSYSGVIHEIDFLKTDIEEMDFYALLGASSFLPKIKFIQFELGLGIPYLDRTVENTDYWELLEPSFDLFILRDEANPIWKAFPKQSLLLALNQEAKILVQILQVLGHGFNIVGINRNFKIPQSILSNMGNLHF